MSARILSKQQQRNALSGKKGSVKGLRNILAQPQDNFWPLVDAEKCVLLENLLKKLMPAIKRPSHSIPWSQLKYMKKEERIQARNEALSKEENLYNAELSNSVILGINAITRSLEKDNICCILMDANVSPPLLIKHVIHMAQNKKMPILLLPKLKIVTLNTIGFASAACALTNIVMNSLDHYFHSLYTMIYDIFKDIPLPQNKLQLFKDVKTLDQSISYEQDKNESEIDSSESIKFAVSTDVYMYRTSRKERIFVPPTTTESCTSEPVIKDAKEDEFISITNYDSDEFDKTIKQTSRYINIHRNQNSKYRKNYAQTNTSGNVTYIPLKVKRIQGNGNRVKATKILKQKNNSKKNL